MQDDEGLAGAECLVVEFHCGLGQISINIGNQEGIPSGQRNYRAGKNNHPFPK
jgi:hypothetical protein